MPKGLDTAWKQIADPSRGRFGLPSHIARRRSASRPQGDMPIWRPCESGIMHTLFNLELLRMNLHPYRSAGPLGKWLALVH